MPSKIVNAKKVHKKSQSHDVTEVAPFTYLVTSGSSGKTYRVVVQHNTNMGCIEFAGATCTCDWGKYRSNRDGGRSGCSHVQAVMAHIEQRESGKTTSAWSNFDDAQRQKRHTLAIGDGVFLTLRAAGT